MAIFRSNSLSSKKADNTVFVFLAALAVAVPTVFFLWSVARAMENESAARRQEVNELNQLQMKEVRRGLNGYLSRMATGKVKAFRKFDEEKPMQCFRQFAKEGVAAGLVILDEKGEPIYPLLTGVRKRQELTMVELDALDLRDRFGSGLDRSARMLKVLRQFDSPEFKRARDTTGRVIYPGLLAYLIPELGDEHARRAGLIAELKRSLNDPAMPTSQRLFLSGELVRFDPDYSPVLSEYDLISLEVLGEPIEIAIPEVISETSRKGRWVMMSDDRRFLMIFREKQLIEKLTSIAVKSTNDYEGLKIEIVPPQAFDEQSDAEEGEVPAMTLAAGSRLPGWELRAYSTKGGNPVSASRRNFYLATAAMALALVGGLAWLASRSYLRQAKETQLRNDFLSTVSHELRTPLTSTRMLVDTLAAGHYKDPERTKKYLDVIARENSRLSHLVETFLTYTRMERGKLQFDFHPASPADIAGQAEASVHERFKAAGVDFRLEVPERLALILADAETLSSAIINLLDNAFKYTGQEKVICLRVRQGPRRVHFEIEDNGEGLSARDRKLIVERFYRTESELTRNSGGSGLGLSIVKFIVEGHGGSLQIESELGKGSVFIISIPILEK